MSTTIHAAAAPPLAPPFTVEVDPLREEALDWVNHVRRELGRAPLSDLRPGYAVESFRCPMSASIKEPGDYSVSVYEYTIVISTALASFYATKTPPTVVRGFIRNFDHGGYRDLREGK